MDPSPNQAAPQPQGVASVPLATSNLVDADFRFLVEAVEDYAIFLMDADGIVLTWNKGAQKLKGYTHDEVVGRHFSLFYPQDLLDKAWPDHELSVARQIGRFEDEGWRIRKDGTNFWANVVITRLTGTDGQLRGFSKITRDLTERRNHEELLRMSEERFRLLVEGVKDYAIFMLDTAGYVESWNAGAQKSKGYAAHEIIGKHFSIFYPADMLAKNWPSTELHYALERGQFVDEGWRIRKDGSRFWANVVITAVHDEQGRHRGFAKVTRDMSEVRRVMALEDEGRKMTTFLAMLGHELRNPLAPISNAALLLERGSAESSVAQQTSGIIRRQVNQLNRLVDDLLDVSRITSGKIAMEIKPVRLLDVIAQAVEASRPLIESKSHVLTIEAGAFDPWVSGDRARLVQVVCNLLNNASKFTPANGLIEIRLSAAGDLVELAVKDNGIGIPPPELSNVFNLFVQGEQDVARTHGGLGLGLSLVHQLVTLHSGDVSAFSTGVSGRGCEFVIRLPKIVTPSDSGAEQVQTSGLSGNGHILVVDDNRDAAETMLMVLESLGYSASAAYDGPSAVVAIKAGKPHVVLLDIGLPGISGIEVGKQVRAEMRSPPALIAVTGYGQASDRELCMSAGFYEHMTKPVDLDRLLVHLDKILPK
jgi:PAS domain S-box-containing protein